MRGSKEDRLTIKELRKSAFKVDLLSKNFPILGKFMLSGYMLLHVGDKKCLLISNEGEEIILPSA